MRVFWSVMLSLTLAATTAFAMAGGEKPDKPDRSDPSLPSSSAEAEASGPRHEAEETYALAYEDMAKAASFYVCGLGGAPPITDACAMSLDRATTNSHSSPATKETIHG